VSQGIGARWAIEFEGRTYAWSDLTLFQASKALGVAGGSWSDLHPLMSPDHLAGLLAAFLAAGGENFDEALARVASMKVTDALELVKAV
jgi:hypothetical protein